MCNANNHSFDCRCGFGGEGHLGGGNGGGYFGRGKIYGSINFLSYNNPFDSYITKDARCPVCGASVYFFKSVNGGRVFFDEIGPPWPKHPCTDTGNTNKSVITLEKTRPNWLKQGWLPATLAKLLTRNGRPHPHIYFTVTVKGPNNYSESIYSSTVIEDLSYESLAFYRDISEDEFELYIYYLRSDGKQLIKCKRYSK